MPLSIMALKYTFTCRLNHQNNAQYNKLFGHQTERNKTKRFSISHGEIHRRNWRDQWKLIVESTVMKHEPAMFACLIHAFQLQDHLLPCKTMTKLLYILVLLYGNEVSHMNSISSARHRHSTSTSTTTVTVSHAQFALCLLILFHTTAYRIQAATPNLYIDIRSTYLLRYFLLRSRLD